MSRVVTVLSVVVLGGVVGTALRFGAAELADARSWPTAVVLLVVNSLGAFTLGWFVEWRSSRDIAELVAAAVSAGVLASFTTFSGVMVEAAELARSQRVVPAVGLLGASLGIGWACALAGRRLGSR
ncbi:MAG: fluoride efflux transporter FluC [Acidimicrobiia bacterium]